MTEEEERAEIVSNTLSSVIHMIRNGELTFSEFSRLEDTLKSSHLYEEDECPCQDHVHFDDVINYIDWYADSRDKRQILEYLDAVGPIAAHSLDDEYRVEILSKLYKTYNSTMELEEALGSDLLNKIDNVVLDKI